MASKRREQAKQTMAIVETAGTQDRILSELAELREAVKGISEKLDCKTGESQETEATAFQQALKRFEEKLDGLLNQGQKPGADAAETPVSAETASKKRK